MAIESRAGVAPSARALSLEKLTSLLFGKASTAGSFASWRGELVELSSPLACPETDCRASLLAALGTEEDKRFVCFCTDCKEWYTPEDVGSSDSRLAAMVTIREDPALSKATSSLLTLAERYERLSSWFDAESECLAVWGMTRDLPLRLRDQAFDLLESHIQRQGGRLADGRSLAELRADRTALARPNRIDRGTAMHSRALKRRFEILFARFDIEGEILGRWGLTSAMPPKVRGEVLGEWRAQIQQVGGEFEGRTLHDLTMDEHRLTALSREPDA